MSRRRRLRRQRPSADVAKQRLHKAAAPGERSCRRSGEAGTQSERDGAASRRARASACRSCAGCGDEARFRRQEGCSGCRGEEAAASTPAEACTKKAAVPLSKPASKKLRKKPAAQGRLRQESCSGKKAAPRRSLRRKKPAKKTESSSCRRPVPAMQMSRRRSRISNGALVA